jgi:hypothetical protein
MGIKVGGFASTLFTVDTDSEPSVSSVCMLRCMYGRRRIVLRWFHRLDLHHELFTVTAIGSVPFVLRSSMDFVWYGSCTVCQNVIFRIPLTVTVTWNHGFYYGNGSR